MILKHKNFQVVMIQMLLVELKNLSPLFFPTAVYINKLKLHNLCRCGRPIFFH